METELQLVKAGAAQQSGKEVSQPEVASVGESAAWQDVPGLAPGDSVPFDSFTVI